MNNKRGFCLRIKIEKKRLILLNKRGIYPSTSLLKEAKFVQIVTLFTLLSLSSSVLCFCLFDTCVSFFFFFFSQCTFFSLYTSIFIISQPDSHLTPLLSWHLSLLTPEEDGGRNLLSFDLHCSSHFLINAADKTVAHHLMWMQQVIPD